MPESFSHHHFKDQRPDVKFFETFQWSCQDGKWRLKWQAHIIMASNCTRTVLCTVQCGVLTFIQKHRKCMAGHGRREVWKSDGATENRMSSEGKGFATMCARIRVRHKSPHPAPFPKALAWQSSDRLKQCFTVLPEPNRTSQSKFCFPNRNQTEPNM